MIALEIRLNMLSVSFPKPMVIFSLKLKNQWSLIKNLIISDQMQNLRLPI
jgi:hypothetical protein